MKLTKYIFYIGIILFFTSCEKDDLDLHPLDAISDASFWQNKEDFKKAANKFYTYLPDHSYKHDRDSDHVMGDDQNGTSAGNITIAPQSDGNWNDNYSEIRQTTRLIEKATEDLKFYNDIKPYLGEAKFFRAWAYFQLVWRFGDVPLITTVLDPTSPELQAPRNDKNEVIDFLLNDLEEAIPLLPKESEIPAAEKGRISKGAALALKSRITLYLGTWRKYHNQGEPNEMLDKSIKAAEDLIALNDYSIYEVGGDSTSYTNLFIEIGHRSKETILNRRYNFDRSITHNATRWLHTYTSTPTKALVDSYLCKDGLPIEKSPQFKGYDTFTSEFENRDPRLLQTLYTYTDSVILQGGGYKKFIPVIAKGNDNSMTGYVFKKYISSEENALAGRASYDRLVFRYAEVLLNLAEAKFEREGAITDDLLDKTINKLRDRINMPHLTNAFVTANGLDMKAELRRERAVELAFEGFRRNDLLRWKLGDILANDIKGVKFNHDFKTLHDSAKVVMKLPLDADGFVIADPASARQWKDRLYVRAVPLDQIKLNPNLTQNPGWE